MRPFLAVDMFFVLSGLVLSFAYQARLDSGMSTWSFLRARYVRLAPLFILAGALAFADSVALVRFGSLWQHWQTYFGYAALHIFFLPTISSDPKVGLYPYDGPCWTLLLELLMNLIHAWFLRRRSSRVLGLICVISGGLLLHEALRFGTFNLGWDWYHLIRLGLPRVVFSYTLGMLLFRWWQAGARIPFPAWLPLFATVVVLWIPSIRNGHREVQLEAALVFVVLPAVVLAAASSEPQGWMRRPFTALGAISYPIYVLHMPVWSAALFLRPELGKHSSVSETLLLLALLVLICYLADVFFDVPLRKWLRARQSRNAVAVSQ